VISNSTQTSSGAGYALEKRIILSRIFLRIFNAGKVMRLAPFFKRLTHCLMAMFGSGKRDPALVMLSSGPAGPAYFESGVFIQIPGVIRVSKDPGIFLMDSNDVRIGSKDTW